jgi:phenylpropionate dioxygenase-like ring-hydroxylating dioxygenase large terminal subunit
VVNDPDKGAAVRSPDFRQYVDFDKGLVDRRIFSDPEIYKIEMERIFARAWNFVVHESQIPNPGDYFMSWIGADQVISVRNKKGGVSVLLNSCRHRGAAVCRAERGNTKTFVCPYHGWSYGLEGELVGVPGLRDFYRNDLNREELALGQAAQVATYKGFVFATMDSEAIPLEEYLGDVGRTGLSMIADMGEMQVVDGVQKNVIGCNWKIAVDNLYDWYHPPVSHKSAVLVHPLFRDSDAVFAPMQQMVMLGDYGHGIGGPMWTEEEFQAAANGGPTTDPAMARRLTESIQAAMGPAGRRSKGHPSIFPNLWITLNGLQMCLRVPRGPYKTELWWFTFIPKDAPEFVRKIMVQVASHLFGPAGILEQDDGENWELASRGTMGPAIRRYPLQYGMGAGHDEVIEAGGQARIETRVNEHGQRWTYQAWSDWMSAKDWPELKANHTPAPRGRI